MKAELKYLCQWCGLGSWTATVELVANGSRMSTTKCTNCGFHHSVEDWKRLSDTENDISKNEPMNKKNPVIYISGPITGIVGENRPAFEAAARALKNLGYIVRNPHEFCEDIPTGSEWHVYMRRSLIKLAECTDIIMLPGWKHSKGANMELEVAERLGMTLHFGMDGFENYLLEEAERRAV